MSESINDEWYDMRGLIKNIRNKLDEEIGISDPTLKVESIRKMVKEFEEKHEWEVNKTK